MPGDTRAKADSDIPITYESAGETGGALANEDVEESTERRDHLPKISEDDVEGTAPTKPRRHRA